MKLKEKCKAPTPWKLTVIPRSEYLAYDLCRKSGRSLLRQLESAHFGYTELHLLLLTGANVIVYKSNNWNFLKAENILMTRWV